MNLAVVLNPATVADANGLRTAIEVAFPDADRCWLETTVEDQGRGQARQALEFGAELALICGGDGTLAACAEGFADSGVPVGLLPVGTGNLLARNLDIPLELDAALEVAAGTGRRRIDVLAAAQGTGLVMAGLGFDAAMIRDTGDRAKSRMGWPAYVTGAVRALRSTPRAQYRIRVDDEPVQAMRALAVLVGNVGQLQGGMAVLPEASPDDGQLDVLVLMPRGAREIAALMLRLLRRTTERSPQARTFRGTRVEVVADRKVPLELDGEYLGEHATLTVEVRPGALIVCVPASP
jgi:YegS/Rv2252/BmrU family lipid kinase